ncbi:MAG: SUMF1/EgtB/PvdO family nonheme iron enzyme [Treponema sp.]|nr:SUMF1/EgtB/PvdO family nonheme iron enzyme [Treponema sp.]
MLKKKSSPEPARRGAEGEKTMLPKDQVRLKPILGVRPGVYLTCLYGLVVLGILFVVLALPGLVNPGALLIIGSEPWGAAVRIDGVNQGTSPCEVFVSRGSHRVELVLRGFSPWETEVTVPGRLFGSRFFPVKVPLMGSLESPNPSGAFAAEASEYTAWSFAGEPTASYQIPLVLSEAAYRLGPSGSDPAAYRDMSALLGAAARFASSRAGLRDLLRAKLLLDNQGAAPSPISLLKSAGDMYDFLGENPGAAAWLADMLQGENRSAVTASSWYAESGNRVPAPPPPGPPGLIRLGDLSFRKIPGTSGEGPSRFSTGDFWVSETGISAEAWEGFLRERPEWRRENREALIEKGLADSGYLETPEFPGLAGRGPSGISWYAARAWCEWRTGTLPPEFSAWEVRLPEEAEWEYAAKCLSQTGESGDRGSFWEWCADPYAPLDFFPAPRTARDAVGSPERSVRGGSWVNPAGSVTVETRGSLLPSSSSPFVSFRPLLAPREAP